jgi:hypothetical protein
MFEEVIECGPTRPLAAAPLPVIRKGVQRSFVELSGTEPPTHHPAAQAAEEPHLFADSRSGVAERHEASGERIELSPDRTRAQPPERAGVLDEAIQHVSPFLGRVADRDKTSGLCRFGKGQVVGPGWKHKSVQRGSA